jgi:predicted Zn-dependent peptidase
LLTKGTKKRTAEQIAVELESVGGGIGAGANEDYSEIGVSITSMHFDKAMEILADVFLNPLFPDRELAKEKVNIIAGIKSRKDSIFTVASDMLNQKMYKTHPYARLTSGSEETVNKITRDDIVAWHKKNHAVPNLLMIVVGNVSLSDTVKYIDKYFGQLPKTVPEQTQLPVPDITAPVTITEKTKFEQAYLMYGYIAGEITSKDYAALKVLNGYLGGGMSSLLFQKLREQAGLGYEVDSFYPSRKEKSRFVIYIGLDTGSISIAKQKITELVADLKQNKIDETRLTEVKNYLKGTFLLDHQTAARQAWYFGWWEMLGKGYEYDTVYTTEIDKITADDVLAAANKYLTDKFVCIELHSEK